MDADNVKTYSKILAETLKKKERVLEQLLSYTKTQGIILEEEDLDEEAFAGIMDEKQQLLLELEEYDDGFMKVYPKVQKEFAERKQDFKAEITELQKLIKSCTDLGVNIQANEEQNHLKFKVKIADSRQKLFGFRQNNKAAASYYKNMANQHQAGSSYFMDKKK